MTGHSACRDVASVQVTSAAVPCRVGILVLEHTVCREVPARCRRATQGPTRVLEVDDVVGGNRHRRRRAPDPGDPFPGRPGGARSHGMAELGAGSRDDGTDLVVDASLTRRRPAGHDGLPVLAHTSGGAHVERQDLPRREHGDLAAAICPRDDPAMPSRRSEQRRQGPPGIAIEGQGVGDGTSEGGRAGGRHRRGRASAAGSPDPSGTPPPPTSPAAHWGRRRERRRPQHAPWGLEASHGPAPWLRVGPAAHHMRPGPPPGRPLRAARGPSVEHPHVQSITDAEVATAWRAGESRASMRHIDADRQLLVASPALFGPSPSLCAPRRGQGRLQHPGVGHAPRRAHHDTFDANATTGAGDETQDRPAGQATPRPLEGEASLSSDPPRGLDGPPPSLRSGVLRPLTPALASHREA